MQILKDPSTETQSLCGGTQLTSKICAWAFVNSTDHYLTNYAYQEPCVNCQLWLSIPINSLSGQSEKCQTKILFSACNN